MLLSMLDERNEQKFHNGYCSLLCNFCHVFQGVLIRVSLRSEVISFGHLNVVVSGFDERRKLFRQIFMQIIILVGNYCSLSESLGVNCYVPKQCNFVCYNVAYVPWTCCIKQRVNEDPANVDIMTCSCYYCVRMSSNL